VSETNYFRKCSTCKREIAYASKYQACSISSCKKFVYCSVDCWDIHDSVLNHKSAWAEENRAPREAASGDSLSHKGVRRRIVSSSPAANSSGKSIPKDVLIVASKLKSYVKAKHDLSTSAGVFDKLSDIVRRECDRAVDNAKAEGRKTLMDRDFH